MTLASTIDARFEVLPVGLDRGPLEAEDLDALARGRSVDDDLDRRARRGDLALELLDREDALALAAEVDEQRSCRGRR